MVFKFNLFRYAEVPAAATMYCMGVEAYTSEVSGFDMSSFNKYRWDKTYEAVRMKDVKHRVLTKPKKAFELFFDGSRGKGRGGAVQLLNAVRTS